MLRITLGVIIGLLVGVIVIGVVEGMGETIFPPPPGVNLTDPAIMATVMSHLPLGAKVGMLLAWFLGVLAGASTALGIAGRRQPGGWIVAAAMFGFAVWTLTRIHHPPWMIAGVVAAQIVAAILSDRAFGRPRRP